MIATTYTGRQKIYDSDPTDITCGSSGYDGYFEPEFERMETEAVEEFAPPMCSDLHYPRASVEVKPMRSREGPPKPHTRNGREIGLGIANFKAEL